MSEEFVAELRPQRRWSTLVALDLFFGGAGAGLFFLAAIWSVALGLIVGWIMVAVGSLFLLADLGKPSRFWRALARPGSSWLSRGVYIVGLFLLLGFIAWLPAVPGLGGLPWASGTAGGTAVQVLSMAAAVSLILYTGMLLSSWPSIPFWNTPLLPLLFLAYSLLPAAAILLALLSLQGTAEETRVLEATAIFLAVASGVALLIYLLVMSSSTPPARHSVRLLLQGGLGWAFFAGVVAAGLALPLALVLANYWGGGLAVEPVLFLLSALGSLAGAYLLRHAWLRVGIYGLPV